jgi:hypothetical protein
MTEPPSTPSSWDEILELAGQAMAARQLKKDNPYVLDLIGILKPFPRGLRRPFVMDRMIAIRKAKGLDIPDEFESTVQSAYNQHSVDSLVFKKRGAPASEGLFFSPTGKGSGKWAVNQDRARAWLIAKIGEDSAKISN